MEHPMNPAMPMAAMPAAQVKAHQEHWMVQVAGGLTVANTIVASLALWTLALYFVILPS